MTDQVPGCSRYKIIVECRQGSNPGSLLFNSLPGEHIFNINYRELTTYEAIVFNYSVLEIAQLEQHLQETAGVISVTIKRVW